MNDYQNAEDIAKREMLKVYTSDVKFNYYKLLLTYYCMQACKIHKKIMTDVKKLQKLYGYKIGYSLSLLLEDGSMMKMMKGEIF